eukprot:15426213-Heterocapsa_arctica.AAC.1
MSRSFSPGAVFSSNSKSPRRPSPSAASQLLPRAAGRGGRGSPSAPSTLTPRSGGAGRAIFVEPNLQDDVVED